MERNLGKVSIIAGTVVLLAIVSWGVYFFVTSAPASEEYDRVSAQEAYNKNQFSVVIEEAEKYLAEHSDDVWAKLNLAVTWAQRGSFEGRTKEYGDKAIALAEDILNMDSNNPEAHRIIGYALETQGDFTRAKESYEHALELIDAPGKIYLDIARLSEKTGSLDDALNYYAGALGSGADNGRSFLGLGRVLYMQGNKSEGKHYLERAFIWTESNRVKAEASYLLGVLEMEEDKLDEAKQLMERSVNADETYALGLVGLAQVEIAHGESSTDESVRSTALRSAFLNVERAISLNSNQALAHAIHAALLESSGRTDEARMSYERAREALPLDDSLSSKQRSEIEVLLQTKLSQLEGRLPLGLLLRFLSTYTDTVHADAGGLPGYEIELGPEWTVVSTVPKAGTAIATDGGTPSGEQQVVPTGAVAWQTYTVAQRTFSIPTNYTATPNMYNAMLYCRDTQNFMWGAEKYVYWYDEQTMGDGSVRQVPSSFRSITCTHPPAATFSIGNECGPGGGQCHWGNDRWTPISSKNQENASTYFCRVKGYETYVDYWSMPKTSSVQAAISPLISPYPPTASMTPTQIRTAAPSEAKKVYGDTSCTSNCWRRLGIISCKLPPVPPPTLNVSCTPSPTAATTGQSVTWSANPTGGTGTYTYSWSGTDSLSGITKNVNKTYATAGTKTANVTVVSGTQSKTVACGSGVAVQTALNVSCTPSPTAATTGQSVTWSANPTGGTGTYTYSWSGTDSLDGSSRDVNKTYESIGVKTGSVTVTSGTQTQSASCGSGVTVTLATPTASLSANPATIIRGQSATLTWTSAHTTGSTGQGIATNNSTSGTRTVSPTATTHYGVTFETIAGSSISRSVTVTVLEPTASISASTNRVHAGDSIVVSWNAENVESCSINGPGIAVTAPANESGVVTGSESVVVSAQSTYIINCSPGGATSQSATIVNVIPSFEEF